MKKFLTIIFFISLFVSSQMAQATELPIQVQNKLKKEIDGVTIRFDGLVEYPDKTQYLPVFPMELIKNTAGKITTTYPANKSLKDAPCMILFDNNFALLKIIKSPNHNPTVMFYNDMPLCVKQGMLPQDLLVPENLVFPEELQILLGDLSIPLTKLSDEFEYFQNFDRFFDPKKAKPQITQNTQPSNIINLEEKAYGINFQANCVYLIDKQTGKIIKTIALRSTPTDFIITRDKRYLVVSMFGTSKLSVIDLKTQLVIKEIDSGLLPTSMVMDKLQNIAYIANQNSSSISVVDLSNMELVNKIEVEGRPTKLTLSFDRKSLIYLDISTDTIYQIAISEDIYDITKLCTTKNFSKAILVGNNLYIICRDKNYVMVLDTDSQKLIKKIEIGEKPVDMALVESKLYIINTFSDTISIINLTNNEKIKDIPLNTNCFPSKINLLDNSTRAIITTASGFNYIIFDLIKDTIVQQKPIQVIINKIIITGKTQ